MATVAAAAAGFSALAYPVRTSLSAAYRAFLDPTLLDRTELTVLAGSECAPRLEAAPPADPAAAYMPTMSEDWEDPEGVTLKSLAFPDLRVPITRRTMAYVRFFARSTAGRASFLDRQRRARPHREIIERALREAGLPEDLLWVAAIESGFEPRAVSKAGAAGLWQFMPATGASYGLEISSWLDERRSVPRSTTAAVAHLRDLYERLGRWDLALAAYNMGYDGVLRAMERAGEHRSLVDGPIELTDLVEAGVVPTETAEYVPRIMGFAIVAANRSRFGLDAPDLGAGDPPEVAEIAVPPGTRLSTVARAAGVPVAVLRNLNPQLLHDRAPPQGGDYLLDVPAERLSRALAALPIVLDQEVFAAAEDLEAEALHDDPLPRRSSIFGKNRLPEGELPGRGPRFGPSFVRLGEVALGAAQTRLEPVAISAGLGWRRLEDRDPFKLLSGGRRSPMKGREAAIDKALAFLDAPPEEEEAGERFSLGSGVDVRVMRELGAADVTITLEHALPSPRAGERLFKAPKGIVASGASRFSVTVPAAQLEVGIELVAGRLELLLAEAGTAHLAALRGRAAAGPRAELSDSPEGAAWLSLGDALFPAAHPLSGTVLGAGDDARARRSLFFIEALGRERAAARASLTITGDVARGRLEPLLDRALVACRARVPEPITPHPRAERIVLAASVPSPRLLLGWVTPAEDDPAHAAVQVAMELLAGSRTPGLERALAADRRLSSIVRGRFEPAEGATVAALEVTPQDPRELADVESAIDAAIAALAAEGPDRQELSLAKALLRIRIERGDPAASSRPGDPARLRRALDPGAAGRLVVALEAVGPEAVRAAAKRHLTRERRVIVTTLPAGMKLVAATEPQRLEPASAHALVRQDARLRVDTGR